jgi:hypothetical protein
MTSSELPRFTHEFIYYVKRTQAGSFAYRVQPDGSGDERIWQERIITAATSPDGRYLAVTVPIEKTAQGGMARGEWKLEIVDWARKRVQHVCNGCIAYWSDDGRSFLVTASLGTVNKIAPTYVVSLPANNGVPELPSKGLTSISDFAKLDQVRTIPKSSIGIGRTPDTYVFIKETVQRNLYRIPLH